MSEPQIVEALTAIRTSPCPGSGTGTFLSSTVLFPGRNAAFIVFDTWSVSYWVARPQLTFSATNLKLARFEDSERAKPSGGDRFLSRGYAGVITPSESQRSSHGW